MGRLSSIQILSARATGLGVAFAFGMLGMQRSLPAALVNTTASTIYDENVAAANQVDAEATAASTTGLTSGTVNLVSLTQFKADLATNATGASTDKGGVITFDDITSSATTYDGFNVSYAGGSKSLSITGTSGNFAVDMTASGTILATPISGNGSTLNYLRSNGTVFNFTPSAGLTEVGFTVLARNQLRKVTIAINYSDASTGNISLYSIAANSALSASSASSSPDTFFGLSAPTGKTITGLTISGFDSSNTASNVVIDDIGFVVPEPASLGVLGVGAAGLLARRRAKAG